jgi:uncharacterized membrane protein HdeD (DUF308 family)
MLGVMTRYWWIYALRGLIAILFGIAALLWPELTITALVILFGAYVVADGVFAIINGASGRGIHDRWWVDILIGLAGIVAGVWAMLYPDLTAIGLMYVIAAWWLFTGIMQVILAIRLRDFISNEWLMILSGLASMVLGIAFLLFPGDGAISLIWVVGVFAIIVGVMLIMLAVRLRGIRANPRIMR